MALSTVSGILTRIGMGKLGRLGLEPARRYERERPGELIHIDVKKLGRIERGAGHRVTRWQAPHYNPTEPTLGRQAPQDRRLGVRAHRDRRLHAPGLRRGAHRREGHDRRGVPEASGRVLRLPRNDRQQLLTDNGSGYRSLVHAIACRTLGIRHLRTRAYRPQTNGKACVLGWDCRPLGWRGSPHLLV